MRYPTVHVLASILAWASAVINPFIYAGTNRQYRAAYRRLLCCSPPRAHQSNTSRSSAGRTFITEMIHLNKQAKEVHNAVK